MEESLVKEQTQYALNRAYFYLKFRPRSEHEVTEYLRKKAEKYRWSFNAVESALASLKESNYINDKDFIEWFVEQRSILKQKSRFALSRELQRFGVAKELIDQYFNEHPIEEDNLALKALERRWPRFKYLDKKERFQKAAAFLSRRGFPFSIIKEAITKLEES